MRYILLLSLFFTLSCTKEKSVQQAVSVGSGDQSTPQPASVQTDSITPLPRQEGTPAVIGGTLFIVKKKR